MSAHSMFKLVGELTETLSYLELMDDGDARKSDYESKVERLYDQIANKFDNSVYAINALESQMDYYKNLAKVMQQKKAVSERAIERLKSNLITLSKSDPNVLTGDTFKGNVQNRWSVAEVNEEIVSDQFKSQVIETKIDKRGALKAYTDAQKEGRTLNINGFTFQQKEHLNIPNRKPKED